jgi:DNA-binding NarL/FixJ family response regulator
MNVVGMASTAAEAVSLAARKKPDVAVLDISLPDFSGFNLVNMLEAAHRRIKVVMFSLHASPDIVSQALHAGVSGYVLKDSLASELLAAIKAASKGERYICDRLRERGMDIFLASQRECVALDQLTGRERQVLKLSADGRCSAQIADALKISTKSVDTYRARIKKKLALQSTSDLVKFAIRNGLTRL